MSEALVDQKQQYHAYVDRLTTQVIAALPISVPDDQLKRSRARFRVAFSADAQGALLECTADSIARAIVLSAMSGLFPGGPKPDVWLIPRRNKHKGNALEVNWQLSFRGFIRLARRAGWDLEPVLVFEGEDFKIEEGNAPKIHHVRNLDTPHTWETLRYGYVRVFREGQRSGAKIAYLTKDQILQRRRKAQDDGIWKEWPLEMALKTLCNYAGNRELFPVDDPARYAMEASEQAELGSGSAAELGSRTAPPLPVSSRSDLLLDKLNSEAIDLPVAAEPTREVLTSAVMLERIPVLLNDHLGQDKEKRATALESAFATRSWATVCKLPADQLELGYWALRRDLEGLVAMKAEPPPEEREPGEDPELF